MIILRCNDVHHFKGTEPSKKWKFIFLWAGPKKYINFHLTLIMYSDSHSAFNLLRVEVSVNEDHQVPDHCEHGPRHKEGGSETRDRRNKCCHMYVQGRNSYSFIWMSKILSLVFIGNYVNLKGSGNIFQTPCINKRPLIRMRNILKYEHVTQELWNTTTPRQT